MGSSPFSSNKAQTAEKYVDFLITNSASWSFTIERSKWPFSTDSWVTAHASDNKQTSELAPSVKVPVALPIYVCPQFINVLKDNNICNGCVDANGILVESVVSKRTSLNVSNKNLTCLDGIENFTALTTLLCNDNQINELNIDQNTKLASLRCTRNNLKSLNLSSNTSLAFLTCDNNKLESLDLEYNIKLTSLNCSYNFLSELNVSKNTKLRSINCANNELFELNTSLNPLLESLNCSNNSLSNLNLINNTILFNLYISNNFFSELKLGLNTNLHSLICSNNPLLSILDLNQNEKLESLECNNCNLQTLDLRRNSILESVFAQGNKFYTLDVSQNNLLISLELKDNINLCNLSILPEQLEYLDVESTNVSCLRNIPSNLITTPELPICSNNPALEEGIDRNVIIDGISYDNVFKVTRNDDFDPKLVANNLDDLNVSCLNLKGTLRWAVMKANSEPDKVNRIEFAPPLGSATFQINLQHGNLDFRSKNITIDGSTVAGYDLAKNPKVVINFNHTGAIDCNYNLPVNGGRGMIYDFNQKFLMKGLGITNATWQKGGQQQGFFIQGFTVTKLEFSDCYFVNTIRNTNPSLSGNSLVARTTYSAPISFHNCTFGNNTEQNLTSVVGFNTLFENQYNMNQIYSGEPFNNFYKCKFLSFSSTPVVNSNNTDSPPYPNKVSQSIFIGNPKNIEYGTAAPQIIGVGLTGNLYGNSISNNTIIEIYKVGANGIDAIEFMGSTKSDLQLKEWSYAVANNLGNKPLVIGEKYIALEVFYNKSFEFSTPFIMIDGRCIVKNTNNAGEGSLRAAITCAVGKREPTDITFEISTNAPYVLKLETALPTFQNLRFPITLAAPLNVKSKTFSIIPNVATANFEPFVVGTNATVSNFIFKGFTNNAPVLVRNGGTLKNSKFEANKNSVIVDGNESRVGGVLSVNTIEDCNFLNGTSTDVFVNTVNSENEFKLNIRACSFGGGVNGIEVIGGKYFENLDILNCYFGYNIETSSTLPMKGLGINLISQLDYTQIKKINVVGCYFTSCLGGGFKSALSGDFNFDSNIFGVSAANKFGVNNFGILLSGQWSNYNITGNHFPNMTNAAVTIAGGAIASANGTIKNNYFGYDLNKNKLIANLPTTTVAIQLSNSTVDIKNNFINKYHKGIVINSSFSSDITFNDFSNTGNSGIEISGLFYGKVNNNRLENFNNFGINFLPTSNSSRNNIEIIGNTLSTSSRTRNIQLANLYYSKVNNNTVNGGGNGIILSNCSFNKFEVNTINDQLSNALILNGESSNNEITNLTVKSESPKNAVAVIINNLCSNNTLKSTIISNYNNGIQIIGEAINNIVSETTINPVTGFAINLSKPSTSTFTGNNNYKAPIVNKLRVQNQNILMTVTAQVNDVVEIFLSEKGTGNQEILRTFVTKINMENSTSKEFAINLADLNTKLNITNPDDKNTYYFRATATNTSGTSRVSNLKFICPNCECIVSNTQDELTAPTNSLREAITKANGGECSKIIFKIPSDELANGIVLKGLLPSIANSYTIDGTQQLGYSNTKYPLVVIKGVSTLSQGLNVLESNVTIKGIAFSGFSTGIILAKPQTELNAVTIGNTVNNYLTINTGANENKIIDCYFGKSIEENALGNTNTNLSNVIRDATTNAIGVVVNSNANIFTNCHIANTRLQNILIRNSCSKNRFNTGSLTNSGKSGLANRAGIVFENTSNVQNNITAPFILAHQVINNKMELTVQTKNTDDFIQVYQSINTPQNAVKFITPQTVVKKTNSNPLVNEWVVTLDNVSYDAAGTYFFVANATDKEDNTSPLSKLYKVNSDYEVCTITSLEELGSGSIREAVECANNAEGKAKIDFAFAEDDQEKTIKLLPTSINHLAITNAFGVMIQPKEKQKMVIGGNGSVKLIFSGNNAIAQNLKLNNIPTEINGGTNHSLSKLVFELSLLTLNKDASNSIIENNSFLDNARLIVNGAKQIRISRNTFNNPGAGTIKAITLSNGGNSSVVNGAKKVPAVRLINLNKGILKFAITSQTPEEKIELFLGTVQGQRALRFLKEYSTTTKSNVVIGELNLKDFTNNDPNINQIVITATGTDKEGNTSELSPNLLMTTCIVNNNQDVPSNPKLAGSLRANVTLVNDGGCQIVMFNIPNDAPEIRLGSVLPIISRSAILDATTLQQGYSEKDEKPVVKITSNSNTLPSGLRISAMVATNGLILDKFATAITIGGTGNNIQILNSSFQNAGIGVSILSGRKDITIDKCTWGDTLGFTSATSIQDLGSENLTVTNSKFFLGENSIAFLSSTNAASTSKNFKFNNNVFSGISNSITKNNSQGFQLTNAIIGNIEKNIFTNVGKPIIAEKSSGTINYNILRRSYQLEKIIRTEAEPKKEILYQHSAIQLNNCFNLKLDSNILTDYRINGIVINGASVTNTILSNRIYKVSNIGIWINNAPNQEVNGNVVDTLANVGILVEPNSPNTILAGNIIRGCKQYGIWVKSERNKIMSNYIGDAPKETLLGNNIGLYLQSNNNLIGNIEGANFFVRNKNGGIVNEGNKNRIIYNTFTYNDVSDRKPSPNVKAIRNVGNANESIQPPRDFSYKKIGEDYEISGKAGANEIIHFYRSNGFPQNTQLTSVKVEWKVINDKGVEEIREGFRQNILGLVKSNDDGTFTFKVIKDNLDPNNTTYIVTTATKLFSGDDAASTSELSKIFPIGPCIISNTEDIADSDANQFPVIGSLRAAIGCANEVLEPAKVITKIFEVPTVELKSDLLPITNKYGLTFSGKNLGFELLESKLHIKPAKDIALNHGLSLSLPNANWENKVSISEVIFSSLNTALLSTKGHLNIIQVEVNGDKTKNQSLLTISESKTDININELKANNLETIIKSIGVENNFDYCIIDNSKLSDVNSMIVPIGEFKASSFNNNQWVNPSTILKDLNFNSVNFENNTFSYNNSYNKPVAPLIECYSESRNSIKFISNTITAKDAPNLNGDAYLIYVYGSITSYNIFDKNTINIKNNNVGNKIGGIYIGGYYENSNNNVSDNTINLNGNAINLQCEYGSSINNKIFNNVINSNLEGIKLEGIYNSNIYNNTIVTNDNNAIKLSSCERIYMTNNLMSGNVGNTKAVELVNSNNRISQDYPVPIIDKVITEKIKEPKPYLELHGMANVGEKIELFFSQGPEPENTLPIRERKDYKPTEINQANTIKFIANNIIADATGKWTYRIPKDWNRNLTENLYITAQGTVDNANSSELSNIYTLKPFTETVIVKNTNNDGEFSLRAALETINSTDFYTKVVFNIQDNTGKPLEGPHVIKVEGNALNEFSNYTGFSIDGKSQKLFADPNDLNKSDVFSITILSSGVNGSQFPTGLMVGEGGGEKSHIKNLTIKNFENGIDLKTGQVKLESVVVKNENKNGGFGLKLGSVKKIETNTTDILFPEKDFEQMISKCLFYGYESSIDLDPNIEKIHISENKFDEVNFGISGSEKLSNSIFEKNIFLTVHRVAISLETKDENKGKYNTNQVIKNNWFGYDPTTTTYASSMSVALATSNMQESYIIDNFIPFIAPNQEIVALVDETMGNIESNVGLYFRGSKDNTISNNYLGTYLDITESNLDIKSHQESIGIKIIANEDNNDKILGNHFANIGTAIKLENVVNTIVANNTIGARKKKTTSTTPNETESTIDIDDVEQLDIFKQAIIVSGKSKNSSIVDNYIGNYNTDNNTDHAGVYLEGEANNIIISKNIIFNKNNNNKGIYLSSATNTDVAEKYPAFEEFRVENKDVILDLKINGLSDIPDNSRVEVFLANGNKMQSKKYIGNAIKTSKAGITSITIPSHFLDYSGSNYFVATYTNAFNGATSRFSENIEIKNLLCSLNENLLGKGVDKICPGEKIENYIEIPKLELKVTCKEPTDAIAKDVKIEKDSRGQKYIIDKAGEYTLLATVPNNSNCDKRIDFTVIYKSEPAMPNFIVKEYVYVGDTVAVVDLDYEVKNRKMEWVHEGVNQITQKITANNQTEDLDTKKAIYLSYPNTGKATISQVSEKDGCVITVSKEINIIPQPNEKKDKGKVSAEIPTLLDADVYPNPVSGNGNLILTLRTKNKAPFTVTLYRIVDSQPLQNFQYKIDRLIQKTGTIDEFQFEQVIDGWQHLAKGVYYLKVNFNNDIKVIKFITN
ncbi:MAG: hypothetical protein EAZ07_09285 [Cytophagales bacterium]|nr:MAG: hypothetical protein EAZ07_09285 [Cytophagales bacterium]